MLSEDQQEIFNDYKNGDNIFITGPGGCGKSFLIKYIVRDAIQEKRKFSVTALTGCAAILLGCRSKTIHSWAGIGLAKAHDDVIATRISLNSYKSRNWKKTQLLIVDEVSMMSKRLFNLLDLIGKKIRKNPKPFGGIQVIFCGDFYQLPPVGNVGDPDSFRFCFESDHWDETFDSQHILDKSYRQTDDTYVNLLNEIREGNLSKYYYNILKTRVGVTYPEDSKTKPVVLYPTKNSVDRMNTNEMRKLEGDIHTFKYMMDIHLPSYEDSVPDISHVKINEDYNDKSNDFTKIEALDKSGMLKVLNSRIPRGNPKYPSIKELINTLDFLDKNSHFSKNKIFKLGSQVMCTANIDMDSGIYNGSVGYITEMRDDAVRVRFKNGEHWISYHKWDTELLPQVTFKQIPLMLAWAVTIHKSQGATLDYAEIDVGSSVFAEGQTYVALSRVRSLDGLFLKSLNKAKIKVNPKVVQFYNQFYE